MDLPTDMPIDVTSGKQETKLPLQTLTEMKESSHMNLHVNLQECDQRNIAMHDCIPYCPTESSPALCNQQDKNNIKIQSDFQIEPKNCNTDLKPCAPPLDRQGSVTKKKLA